MQPRMILAIARKDALDLVLNKATLGGLLFPILLSLVWLLIINTVGERTTDVLVYNPGASNVVQAVLAVLPGPHVTQAGSAAEVAAAFASGGPSAATHYAAGLIVPADLDASVRAGGHPRLQLYLDGKAVNAALMQSAIITYGRTIANLQPPVDLVTSVVNPSPGISVGMEIRGLYVSLALLLSLTVGITFVPQLLIEEKERKTLRMLMVTPASFGDILLGKLLVVLVYQLVLTGVVLAILGAFTGHVELVILYALLGACFSLTLGLLIGAIFNTTGAAAAVEGPVILIYITAGTFVGPLAQMMSGNPALSISRLLPTLYLAEGVYNAVQAQGSFGEHMLDIAVMLGCTIMLLLASAWVLRRQSAVAATI